MNDTHKINAILYCMLEDPRYEKVKYALGVLKSMEKEMSGATDDLHMNIDTNMLLIPAYMSKLPDEAIKWMLLHEAAHLTNGDDVDLKRVIEILDHCYDRILTTMHAVMERNANIMTIEIYGGIQEDILVGTENHDPKKMKTIRIGSFHKLIGDIQTIVKTETDALHKALESI